MAADRHVIESLGSQHRRERFSSGSEVLDRYLRQQASQDVRNHIARCFILRTSTEMDVLGYYTLSSYGIQPHDLPPEIIRRLPRYPLIPTILLGRLAVDAGYQGRGSGRRLLFSALARSAAYSYEVAAFAVVVDAKDEAARHFYERYGFVAFAAYPQRLYLSMRSIVQSGLGIRATIDEC